LGKLWEEWDCDDITINPKIYSTFKKKEKNKKKKKLVKMV
jgi:hypothetical protein